MDDQVLQDLSGGGRSERVPLKNQAQAVTVFLEAARDALESAKIAAEHMDAEQANAHMHLIRPAARTMMACLHGVRQSIAQWQSMSDQLPAVIVLGRLGDEHKGSGPRYEAPNLCTACGGSRKLWSSALQRDAACTRCQGSGQEPKAE